MMPPRWIVAVLALCATLPELTNAANNSTNGTTNGTNGSSNSSNGSSNGSSNNSSGNSSGNSSNSSNGSSNNSSSNATNNTTGNGSNSSNTTTTTTNLWFPTGCYRNACGCPSETPSNSTTITTTGNGTSCEGTDALVQNDKCQMNQGTCQAPGQNCDGTWCESTVTTTCPPTLTEGCYKPTCGCGSSDPDCFIVDDKCQKNQGVCEAPGQMCGGLTPGMWCDPSVCSTTSLAPASTTTTTTTTSNATTSLSVTIPPVTTTVSRSTDCTSNPTVWEMLLTGIDEGAADLEQVIKCAIATVQNISCDCVTVEGSISSLPTARRLIGSRRLVTGMKGNGAAPAGVPSDEIAKSCQGDELTNIICAQVGQGAGCNAQAVCSQFTTTTEMPWGMPWWAWFLICCGICSLCAFLCLPLLGAPMMGGKKKKATPSTEVIYEVVDVPDDQVPLAAAY